MDEEVEAVKIRRIGVLSFAGTFAIINMISGFVLSLIFLLIMPLILPAGTLSILPFQISSLALLAIVTLGYGLVTFIFLIIAGLFYNLAALITKGIKLYS
jgi:hypothetical protein